VDSKAVFVYGVKPLTKALNAHGALVLMAMKLFAGFRRTSQCGPKFQVVGYKNWMTELHC
jgi:hypothetical protein